MSFADSLVLLHIEFLCECGATMRHQKKTQKRLGLQFAYSNFRSICRAMRSILAGTWFYGHNMTLRQAPFAICAYANDMDCRQFAFCAGIRSMNTVVDWRGFFREVCAAQIRDKSATLIGGSGFTVEIDETLVYKRKSNTGRLLSNQAEHVWVFGGLCREACYAFVIRVADRSRETLFRAIHDNIAPKSKIINDNWCTYTGLYEEGYSHAVVNHRYNIVDPSDPSVNTQRVERMWRTLKSIIPKTSNKENRWSYLDVFIFKQRNHWFQLSVCARMKCILDENKSINFF